METQLVVVLVLLVIAITIGVMMMHRRNWVRMNSSPVEPKEKVVIEQVYPPYYYPDYSYALPATYGYAYPHYWGGHHRHH